MAVAQRNMSFFDYLDDNGVHWNVQGEDGGPGSAIDGHATDYTLTKWGKQTRKRHVRYATFYDPATFRTYRTVVYTPTAYAAIVNATTVSVPVAGGATSVTYNLAGKTGELNKPAKASRHLAES